MPGWVSVSQQHPRSGSIAVTVPFAQAALWAASLPELQQCAGGIGPACPADTQHGGPNPLSALNTLNYILNNLRAALRHTTADVDPAFKTTIGQVQAAIAAFLAMPALDSFNPIMSATMDIVSAVQEWLQQQPPATVLVSERAVAALPMVTVPSDGRATAATYTVPVGNGGLRMPAVGFGTWKLEGKACYDAVSWALAAGIRHIDTAEAYGNEADIGRALTDSGIARGELFIATKATSVPLGMADVSYLEAVFIGQLQALQTEYVDLYMLHAAGVKGEQLKA
eukprot:1678301-Amphidinium_carterae.1